MTDGLVLLAAWGMFIGMLAALAFVIARSSGRRDDSSNGGRA